MNALSEYTTDEQEIVEGILRDGIEKKVFKISDIALTTRALIISNKRLRFLHVSGREF